MRRLLALFCSLVLMSAAAMPAAAASNRKKRSASAQKTVKKTTAKKTSSKKKISTRKSSRRTVAKTRRAPSQRTPSPERYREIQQALAQKGYFTGEANGTWGASSVEALKRFQQDQSIEPTGRINSLSLIALGLGPQYERAAAQTLPAETPPPNP